jgi:SsrA-binding protein
MSIKIVADNRQARFNYFIEESFEAGLVLQGSEVKSIRDGKVQLKDSFVAFIGDEAFLQNSHISVYEKSSHNNHEPERRRKLLLNRSELSKIFSSLREKGLTCVPLKLYFKNGRVKVEIALVKGKKLHDKRETIKKRDVSNQIRKSLRRDR